MCNGFISFGRRVTGNSFGMNFTHEQEKYPPMSDLSSSNQSDVTCIGAQHAHGQGGARSDSVIQWRKTATAVERWKIRNSLARVGRGSFSNATSISFSHDHDQRLPPPLQTSRLPTSSGNVTPTTSKSSFLGRSFSTAQMGPVGSAPSSSGAMAAPDSPYGTLKRGAPGRGSATRLTPYKCVRSCRLCQSNAINSFLSAGLRNRLLISRGPLDTGLRLTKTPVPL